MSAGTAMNRLSATAVDVDEVDADRRSAERRHHRAQSPRGTTHSTDDLAKILGVDPHFEDLAAALLSRPHLDIVGVGHNAFDEMLERLFKNLGVSGRHGVGSAFRGFGSRGFGCRRCRRRRFCCRRFGCRGFFRGCGVGDFLGHWSFRSRRIFAATFHGGDRLDSASSCLFCLDRYSGRVR